MSNNSSLPSMTMQDILDQTMNTTIGPKAAWPFTAPYSIANSTVAVPTTNAQNYTLTGTTTLSPSWTNIAADGLTMSGNADIKFGNISLKDFMESVSQRLAMLVPNPQLEKEWEELRTLGEAYRAVEKECIEKSKVWNILNK